MVSLTLLLKIYGRNRSKLLGILKSRITNLTSELDVTFTNYRITRNNRVSLTIKGEDEEFVTNVLAKEYGLAPTFDGIETGQLYPGQLVDVGKVGYGLYADIGVTKPKRVDALIPLHRLRSQLQMHRSSLRSISNALLLAENLPIEVRITEINRKNSKIEAELSNSTLQRLDRWINDDHQRLLVFGATLEMIDSALQRAGHAEDIYKIEQLGVFEFSLRCKRSTRASGIVAAIGPKMRGVPMHLFIPSEIEAKRDAAP